MPTIYVLRCEGGCYFIGHTRREYFSDVDKHFQGAALEWTKIHKPIRLHLLRYFCDEGDVDVYTRAYMYRYGIDKVRGGKYSECVLSAQQMKEMKEMKEIKEINNDDNIICGKCGVFGHNITKCPFPSIETDTYTYAYTNDANTFEIEQHNENHKSCNCLMKLVAYLYQSMLSLLRQRSPYHNTDLFQSLYNSNV
jgi:hypothetical protein